MNCKGYKHLSLAERHQIEALYRAGMKPYKIAEQLERCAATIYAEIRRGAYVHHSGHFWKAERRYASERAHDEYRQRIKGHGKPLKIENAPKLKARLQTLILDKKMSPEAALMEIERNGEKYEVEIKSARTIYSYIRRGVFEGLTMENLPYRPRKTKKKKVRRGKRPVAGKSIEKRPEAVDSRDGFGNWEMDTVKGKATNRKTLLVLTERKTRYEIMLVLNSNTTKEACRAIDVLERRYEKDFKVIFKTITVDNGSEFQDSDGMERSVTGCGKRTEIYYCHPYRSSERGSNENQNKMIRRHYPKGSDFDKTLTGRGVKKVENWMNNYPRKLFDGGTAGEMFEAELELLRAG